MNCTIITIGDELLIGQTIDTNSAWIGQELVSLGLKVYERIAVGDDATHIKNALRRASQDSDIIIITGGLGPTKDDITKHTLCEYFGVQEKLHEPTLERLRAIFEKRGKEIFEMNKKQAMLPENCTVLENGRGTAPGMWFDEKGKIYVSLPGVPHEMKFLMTSKVLPKLKEQLHVPPIIHKNMMVVGLGESTIAKMIAPVEDKLPVYIRLAYLPELGIVKLRLSGYNISAEQQRELLNYYDEIRLILGDHVFALMEMTLAEAIGNLCVAQGKTFAVAESCTGGYVGHLVTSNPGCSAYFKGSLVTYSYDLKEQILGVSKETLATKGAVSEECVKEMLIGLLAVTKADYGVSISGIAGPDGSTPDKPVGTVCFAVGTAESIQTRTFTFFPGRMENIRISATTALNLLRKKILESAS